MMTNGEHDFLWKEGAKAMVAMSASLRRANLLVCLEKLHDIGQLDDATYIQNLVDIATEEGATVKLKK